MMLMLSIRQMKQKEAKERSTTLIKLIFNFMNDRKIAFNNKNLYWHKMKECALFHH